MQRINQPKPSFLEAQQMVLNHVQIMNTEQKSVLDALGQAAAEEIKAGLNVPGWDASALDGFALHSKDICNADRDHPAKVKLKGTILAGQLASQKVAPGYAVRIMTGAPLPEGADCVVGFEDSHEYASKTGESRVIKIFKAIPAGGNIRRAGEQIKQGAVLLKTGRIIGPGEIGLLAATGITQVKVIRRPRVAILSSGDELVAPGGVLRQSKIFCSNSSALAAQVKLYGGLPYILKIARDNLRSIRTQIVNASKYDMLITSGGSAGGDRDLIKEIMRDKGKLIFDGVEMTPGKSTAFGRTILKSEPDNIEIPHWSLSGNPTAAMLTFETMVRPAILKSLGLDSSLSFLKAASERLFTNPGAKTRLVWAYMHTENGRLVVSNCSTPGGVLLSIATANCIAIIPPEVKQISAGEEIQVLPLAWS